MARTVLLIVEAVGHVGGLAPGTNTDLPSQPPQQALPARTDVLPRRKVTQCSQLGASNK